MGTEQQGPFFIERGTNHGVVVRSKLPFRYTVYWTAKSERQAAIYAMPPMGLQEGMKLVLSAKGHDDVVINGGGDAA